MSGRKKAKYPPFVALSRIMLKGQEWRKLSRPAMIIYIYLKYKYVGHNNGEIQLHYSELKDIFAPATMSKALRELKGSGWIEVAKVGGLYRYFNLYRLTGKYDTALSNYNF